MNKPNSLRYLLLLGFLVWTTSACSIIPLRLSPTPWPTPSIRELIQGFASSDAVERTHAASGAGFYYDHPDRALLVPYLAKALNDPDREVRVFAAQSIWTLDIYDEQAVATLVSWLDEEGHSNEELIQGIQALKVFANHASDATPGLVRVMMDPPSQDPHVRQAAARALSAIGDPVAVPYLLSVFLSTDEQGWVRKDVAIALAGYGPAAVCAVPYLVPMLESSEPDVRAGAALVISQATENDFPGSERRNWDPEHLGAWLFEKDVSGEYLIVKAAKEWWKSIGQYRVWPECDRGLNGESVLPTVIPASTDLP